MIKKLANMLSPGKGKVDLVLDQDVLIPGSLITGTFYLQGPKKRKKVSRLECDLMAFDPKHLNEKPVEIATTIYMSKEIDRDFFREIPFSYTIPEHLKDKSDQCRYRFRTKLIFEDQVQYIDHDELKAE
ncbi:sporulation protein [Jeotgalibacillus malaysiensis]|uniref:sporulation protein n=1 Tax=Jeotgalibacillus malaysiensis TaxID=1508404 RepID=UPI00384B78BB